MNSISRSIKTPQIKLRELNFGTDGTAVTPVATGLDAFSIKEVIDNGTGNYTFIFNLPFELAAQLKGFSMLAAGRTLFVDAIDFDRITVQCTDLAGADADAAFFLSVVGSDHRLLY